MHRLQEDFYYPKIDLMGNKLGYTDRAEHAIVMNSPPIKQRYYRVSPIVSQQINKELDDMLEQGIVEPTKSPPILSN